MLRSQQYGRIRHLVLIIACDTIQPDTGASHIVNAFHTLDSLTVYSTVYSDFNSLFNCLYGIFQLLGNYETIFSFILLKVNAYGNSLKLPKPNSPFITIQWTHPKRQDYNRMR